MLLIDSFGLARRSGNGSGESVQRKLIERQLWGYDQGATRPEA
jgi:hypothetical protein